MRLLAEEIRELGAAARLSIFLKLLIGKKRCVLLHLFRAHLLISLAIKSFKTASAHLASFSVPARPQILV